ncbi:MAG TPA: class I SAM-dependent methyltransferase [Nevskiaceae bacterium]|nr:class I SAM-dependent methyltransferase [Nevskiaceae bacterium]
MDKLRKWGEDPEFSGPRDWFRNSLIIKEIIREKTKGKVLDFGVGSGNLLFRLAAKGFVCTGIDKSRLALNCLRLKAKEKGFADSIKAKEGDEGALTKIKQNFDIVVSGETLEHLKDDQKTVKGFYRILKKGGICVVSVPAHMWLWDANDDFSAHYRRYEKPDLIRLLESECFNIVRVYYWGFPLSLLWHRLVYLPLIFRKIKQKRIYTDSFGLLSSLIANEQMKKFFSIPFWLDELFNWTMLGGGLILVAKK